MATLNGTDLGHIRSEQNGKSTTVFQQPLPGTDSSGTLVIDLFGVVRKINIQAVQTGDTSTLQTFINAIETLMNGAQAAVTFVSSIHDTNKNVMIENFRYTYAAGSPRTLNYTLDLIEGSAG